MGFHDVTKTKDSHHRGTNRIGAAAEKQTWPGTAVGVQLGTEIKASSLPEDTKAKLIRDIIDHEATNGQVTKTFMKKVRKQVGPPRKP